MIMWNTFTAYLSCYFNYIDGYITSYSLLVWLCQLYRWLKVKLIFSTILEMVELRGMMVVDIISKFDSYLDIILFIEIKIHLT